MEVNTMLFKNDEHKEFYDKQIDTWKLYNKGRADCYAHALIYTLGICDDTRLHFESICDVKRRRVVPKAIYAGWQSSGSTKVTRLAFQLFTDQPVTAYSDTDGFDFDECKEYSVSDIFCCGFAPYFVEAIKLRYPEYFAFSHKE